LRDQFRAASNRVAPLLICLIESIEIGGIRHRHPPEPFLATGKNRRFSGCRSDQARPLAITEWPANPPKDRKKFDDKSGKTWAILSFPLRRHIEIRCEADGQADRFESLAEDAGKAMLATPPSLLGNLPLYISDLCVPFAAKQRVVFGDIPASIAAAPFPKMPLNNVIPIYQGNNGVMVDWPFLDFGDKGWSNWILLTHRLAWQRYAMPRLEARRRCWSDDGVSRIDYDLAMSSVKPMARNVDHTQWYSVIGDDNPLDAFEASARAIDIILETIAVNQSADSVEVWSAPADDLSRDVPTKGSPDVILDAKNRSAIVRGKTKPLTKLRFRIVQALINARPRGGLTKNSLEKLGGGARGALREMRKKDTEWASVIHMAETPGGRYLID